MARKIRVQFYQYGNNPVKDTVETLQLGGKPNSIKFVCVGDSIAGLNKFVVLNNYFQLQPYTDTVTGTAQAPYILEITPHVDDVLIDQYTLKIPAGAIVNVVATFITN